MYRQLVPDVGTLHRAIVIRKDDRELYKHGNGRKKKLQMQLTSNPTYWQSLYPPQTISFFLLL